MNTLDGGDMISFNDRASMNDSALKQTYYDSGMLCGRSSGLSSGMEKYTHNRSPAKHVAVASDGYKTKFTEDVYVDMEDRQAVIPEQFARDSKAGFYQSSIVEPEHLRRPQTAGFVQHSQQSMHQQPYMQ